MKKISLTGIIGAVILIIIGVIVAKTIMFIGIGFILGLTLNSLLLKIDNSLLFKNKLAPETIPQMPVQETEKKIKYNENLSNKYLELKESFNEFRHIDILSEPSTLSLMQLERSVEKFERFIEILSNKFDPEELSYSKFFITVEQVYVAILDNLDNIKNRLHGIGGKDYSYLLDRLDEFERMEKMTQSELEEKSTIRQKKGMVKQEMKKIHEILSTTESVISSLDRILLETSSLKTSSSKLDISGTHAISELEQLIKNAKLYNLG